MYIMNLLLICLFILNQIFSYKNDDSFDNNVRSIDSILKIKVSGYRNHGNRGVNKGCCGNKVNKICLACKYYIQLYRHGYSVESYSERENRTTIVSFSRESEELYENYNIDIIFSASAQPTFKIQIFSTDYTASLQDEFLDITSNRYASYRYEGGYGVKNYIELWAEIILSPISYFKKYWHVVLKIDSIYWNEYRYSSLECCNDEYSDDCEEECGYNIDWKGDFFYYGSTDNLIPRNNIRHKNTSITLTSDHDNLQKRNLEYDVKVFSSRDRNLIDSIKIEDVNDLPNVEYKIFNLKGKYGNLIFNISYMHSCQVFSGINCNALCEAGFGYEYCDSYSLNKYCLNGATDINTCIDIPNKCTTSICKNNGICQLSNNNIVCNCLPGFSGKFCQEWQCESSCNGNGVCNGPNICDCYYPYTGKNCEEYPCGENFPNICGTYGICKIKGDKFKCDCTNPLISGEKCDKAICANTCIFGKCLYNKKHNITNCSCDELYEGISCDKIKVKINDINTIIKYGLSIALISFFILLLLISFIYLLKAYIFNNSKTHAIQNSNKEG